jgi:hypothetical protein
MTLDEHIQALRQLLVTDHEETIARVKGWAAEAAARGNHEWERWHLDHAASLEAIPYPWEKSTA